MVLVFVSVGASYDAPASGRTHQAPEDVSIMSTLPGMERARARPSGRGRGDPASDGGWNGARLHPSRDVRQSRSPTLFESHDTGPVRVGQGRDCNRRGTNSGANLGGHDRHRYDGSLRIHHIRPFDAEMLREVLNFPAVVLVEPYLAATSSGEVSAALRDVPHRLLALGVDRTEHRRYGTQFGARYGLWARRRRYPPQHYRLPGCSGMSVGTWDPGRSGGSGSVRFTVQNPAADAVEVLFLREDDSREPTISDAAGIAGHLVDNGGGNASSS